MAHPLSHVLRRACDRMQTNAPRRSYVRCFHVGGQAHTVPPTPPRDAQSNPRSIAPPRRRPRCTRHCGHAKRPGPLMRMLARPCVTWRMPASVVGNGGYRRSLCVWTRTHSYNKLATHSPSHPARLHFRPRTSRTSLDMLSVQPYTQRGRRAACRRLPHSAVRPRCTTSPCVSS